jgi:HK97 family phage major capsid protein
MPKPNLKQVKEEHADIINKMEALHNDKGNDGFDEKAQDQWNDWKSRAEELEHVINREETLVKMKGAQLNELRNTEDGEAKELSRYSIAKAIRQASDGSVDDYYAEMSKEAQNELVQAGASPVGSKNSSLYIPAKVLSTRGAGIKNQMVAGTADDGGNAVATELRSFIDHLWDRMVTLNLGADMLTGLTGNIDWPTESTVAAFAWAANEATAEVAESEPKVGKVSISPKRGGTFVDLSNQLLNQTSPSIDARIERQIINAAQRGLESAGIAGDGSGGSPTGILGTNGIGAVYAGGAADNNANAHGANPIREDIINLETAIAIENADIGALNYLTNAKVRGALKNTKVDAGSGLFVWPFNSDQLNGYNVGVTNLVPSDIEKGDSDDLSAAIFGNFNDLVYGMWGGLEILRDPYTQSLKGITRLVLNVYADVAVLRAKSFAAVQDIDTDIS